jgi:hypothetical protein
MALINERGHPFDYYVRALRGQYGNDLELLIKDSNKDVFNMRRKPTPWFMKVSHNKLQVGKFYLICYNFNGCQLYCPIFSIDYRIKESGKHVMYAINLDYLPFDYKVSYFNQMNTVFQQIFQFNSDALDFMQERPITVNFEQIYNTLKTNGGYNYAISAFDITKITELFGVSTNLMYLMIHIHLRPVNVALMKTLMEKYEMGTEEREKLQKTVNELNEMHQTYEEDIKDYYKKLRNLENNYKLFED